MVELLKHWPRAHCTRQHRQTIAQRAFFSFNLPRGSMHIFGCTLCVQTHWLSHVLLWCQRTCFGILFDLNRAVFDFELVVKVFANVVQELVAATAVWHFEMRGQSGFCC